MSTTLAELRVGVLGMIGDVDELEATASDGLDVFIDDLNLARESGTLVGRFLIFDQASANPGLTRRVVANSKSDTSVTLNKDLPSEPQVGDRALLINYRDQGMSKAKVDRNINGAIRACAANYLVPNVVVTSVGFSSIAPVLDASAFRGGGIAAVDVKDADTSEWIELPLMDWRDSVDQWAMTVTLGETARRYADTKSLRIRGYSKPGQLVNDSDETIIDYEWLVLQAAANCHMELARRRMDPANNERWGQYRQDQADERIGKVSLPSYGYYVPLLVDGVG